MANSLLRTGGFATIPHTATPNAPAIVYDRRGDIVGTANADGGACNVFGITNTDANNWLWVQLVNLHQRQEAFIVLPGQTIPFQMGFAENHVKVIQAWTTQAASTSQPSTDTVITGGFQGAK